MVFKVKKIENKVAVMGIGGAGCNVIGELIKTNYPVDTIAVGTQSEITKYNADKKLLVTKDALSDGSYEKELGEAVSEYEAVFVVSGLGGETGTTVAPKAIEIIQSMNIVASAVAIKPFSFEGKKAMIAKTCCEEIKSICCNTMAIENDMIIEQMADLTMDAAFTEVNKKIMAHIDVCIPLYVTFKDSNNFNRLLKKSPLYAISSA